MGQGWSLLRDVLKLKPSHEVGAQPQLPARWLLAFEPARCCSNSDADIEHGNACAAPTHGRAHHPLFSSRPATACVAGLATEVRDSSRIHLFLDPSVAQPTSGRATPASRADSGVDGRVDSAAGRAAEV